MGPIIPDTDVCVCVSSMPYMGQGCDNYGRCVQRCRHSQGGGSQEIHHLFALQVSLTHTQYAIVGQYPILMKLWEEGPFQNVSNLGTVAHNIFHCGAVPEIVGQSSNHFLTKIKTQNCNTYPICNGGAVPNTYDDGPSVSLCTCIHIHTHTRVCTLYHACVYCVTHDCVLIFASFRKYSRSRFLPLNLILQ